MSKVYFGRVCGDAGPDYPLGVDFWIPEMAGEDTLDDGKRYLEEPWEWAGHTPPEANQPARVRFSSKGLPPLVVLGERKTLSVREKGSLKRFIEELTRS